MKRLKHVSQSKRTNSSRAFDQDETLSSVSICRRCGFADCQGHRIQCRNGESLKTGFLESSYPHDLFVCNDRLYFETSKMLQYNGATDEITDREDYPQRSGGSACFNDELYYFDGIPQEEECDSRGRCSTPSLDGIYMYDGSTSTVVYDAKASGSFGYFFEYQSELYFGLEGPRLMKTSGEGAELLCDLQTGWFPIPYATPKKMTEHNGSLYFLTRDEDENYLIYKYDKVNGCGCEAFANFEDGGTYIGWYQLIPELNMIKVFFERPLVLLVRNQKRHDGVLVG